MPGGSENPHGPEAKNVPKAIEKRGSLSSLVQSQALVTLRHADNTFISSLLIRAGFVTCSFVERLQKMLAETSGVCTLANVYAGR
ncbi:hypothetical protein PG994_014722 [Apiospora phragmitis]|uniref:Uncharacterized protein n=1 Tax=Apiospora phragmitis TaxID=2905665 RepID=A0ABR1SW91_9PEZI